MRNPRTSATILVLDDDESVRNVTGRLLAQRGYRVLLAASAEEGLAALRRQRVDCLLLDLQLPDMSGMDLLPNLLEVDPNLAVVVLTGDLQAPSAAAAMRSGVVDYLTKPVEIVRLSQAVEGALLHHEHQIERQEMQRWLREEVAERREEVLEERERLEQLATSALEVLVTILEAKDRFMAGHSVRVAQLAASIASELGHPDDEIEQVRTAGRLHDLGMIVVRDRVLNKQGPLTEEEFEEIRHHPLAGYELLQPHPNLTEVARFVRSHHERVDGGGYPDGLAGDQIPWGARILAAAEIYDALITDRVYRPQRMTPDEAWDKMEELAGSGIDRAVQRALGAVIARRRVLEFLPDEVQGRQAESIVAALAKPVTRGAGAVFNLKRTRGSPARGASLEDERHDQ
jgi:response regulator RpfG family c-di-GMP phosphodiesterase